MRIDFYQLGKDPVQDAVTQIAHKVLSAGKRLLVVAEDPALQAKISEALWAHGNSFLANGLAGDGHEDRQPILFSPTLAPQNGATFLALADGIWREPDGYERVFLFFDETTLQAARLLWKELGTREGAERHFWKQDGGRWVEAA
ncbi:MAG: hypothetical protein RLZZ136_1303 [Pseudomonadota bacterium]|jgi:DNA polymerase-3 subunit chi